MNGRFVLACAISGLALSTFGATTAHAGPPPDPSIGVLSDGELTPGAGVTVTAVCPDEGFTSSEVTSPALTAEAISRAPSDPMYDPMTAAGKINDNAKAGTYPVSFVCGGATISAEFTVVADPEQPPPAEPPYTAPPQVSPRPEGAADTGSLDPAPDQGPDAGVVALGGMVLLAAGGLGIATYRRRQRT